MILKKLLKAGHDEGSGLSRIFYHRIMQNSI